jgi:TIR domain
MSFKHACFISYRNGDRDDFNLDSRRGDIQDTVNAFAKDLRDELKRELITRTNPKKCLIFLDQDKPDCWKEGDPLMQTFSNAVCKSVCMIVVFTPNYLDKDHLTCAAELEGMLRRLDARCEKISIKTENSTNWIATVVLREPERVPEILKKNLYFDFTGYDNSSTILRDNEKYRKNIQTLAKSIADFWEVLDENYSNLNFCDDCATFALLDPQTEAQKLLDFVKTHKVPVKSSISRS